MGIESSASYVAPAALAAWGMKETMDGALAASEGNLSKGMEETLVGLTATNLGIRCMEVGSPQHLMKASLLGGSVAVAAKGAWNLLCGIKNRSIAELQKGAAGLVMGAAVIFCLNQLDSKVVLVAHQTSVVALAGSAIAWIGVKDLAQGKYRKGTAELVLGVAGVASAGYYAYNELFYEESVMRMPDEESAMRMPDELDSFLQDHKSEILRIYKTKRANGEWKRLENGISKISFSHPNSDYIIKIPKPAGFLGFLCNFPKRNIESHYGYSQNSRQIIQNQGLKSLIIPDSYLIETEWGPMVAERRLQFSGYFSVPDSPLKQAAIEELRQFQAKSGLCDVWLEYNHNAAFLEGSDRDPKIGIFDFDCNTDVVTAKAQPAAAATLAEAEQPAKAAREAEAVMAEMGILAITASGKTRWANAIIAATGLAAAVASVAYGEEGQAALALGGVAAMVTGVGCLAYKTLSCVKNRCCFKKKAA